MNLASYIPTSINTMDSFYFPGFGGSRAGQPFNQASGGLPTTANSAALFWVGLVALLVVFRIAWEMSPAGKG